MVDVMRSDFSRVFLIEHKAGPANVPSYQGLWKAGAISWAQGDVTPIRIPSSDEYGAFLTAGKIPGEKGNPELPITSRYTTDLSTLLRLARNGCDHDLQVHMGRCKNPQDFNGGWEKILILEGARLTNYGTGDLGALGPDERAIINEEVPFVGDDLYEVKPLTFAKVAESEVVQEVVSIVICDAVSCGLCGLPSDGCQIVFALTKTAGGSPGLPAEIIFTDDGGKTWDDTLIDTLGVAEEGFALACVGTYLVVTGLTSCSIHYAPIADILAGTETWIEVTSGFVASKCPQGIYSVGPSLTWIVGEDGYIYFTSDPTSGVEVQDAGVATIETLSSIHGIDSLNLVAVGANNAVVFTRNGGQTWESITGPDVGILLNTVWMKSEDEWWIGTSGGKLWYTRDAGVTWTQKRFSGDNAGQVNRVIFVTPSVGYVAHRTATPVGRILRTIDGGYSWYILPEGSASMPVIDYLNDIAVCGDPNIVFAGGLADNAIDGIILKGA